MSENKSTTLSLGVASTIAAATIGNGIFALPYVFYKSGWLVSIVYLALTTVFIAAAHVVYLQTLEARGEKERLLELARRYFGESGFWIGFISIVVGLLLSLVAFLILGSQFIVLAAGLPQSVALIIFWCCISIPIFLSDRRVAALEIAGILCVAAIIVFIFLNALPHSFLEGVPAVNLLSGAGALFPLNIILFALAGWTGVEPAYELRKRLGKRGDPWRALAIGTAVIAFLYLLFSAGILGSIDLPGNISSDTISGLVGWALWKRELIAVFGLIAMATVYLPISREIKNALEVDLRRSKLFSRILIVFLPIIIVELGVRSFVAVVGLTGGLFISIQYILIIGIGKKALSLPRGRKILLNIAALVFLAAAVYEVAGFIVH